MRDVIEYFIDQPWWGIAKVYNHRVLSPDQAYFFFAGPDLRVFFVVLWSPNSRFLLFKGSRNQKIPTIMDKNFGIMKSSRDEMRRRNIAEEEVVMPEGGM